MLLLCRLRRPVPRLLLACFLPALFVGLAAASRLAASIRSVSGVGVCDSDPPTSSAACFSAMQDSGLVVSDVFRDAVGRAGPDLAVFGRLYNNWPGCATVNFATCSGQSNSPWDCPGEFSCTGAAGTFLNASSYANALDRLWWQPCRLLNHFVVDSCPDWTCVADGAAGDYLPWEGLVFDLGAAANRVALFGELVSGPHPCQSVQFTVYLTNSPASQERVQQPAVDGVDPTKWNRATLSNLFTKGWADVRPADPAGHAACGDTAAYAVEMDALTQIFSLPPGAALRYAAVVAGNDGLDFPACSFDTSAAELDSVAGLTEGGVGICPDFDFDGALDCNCPTAPPVCDCDDADPNVATFCHLPIFLDGFESGDATAWSSSVP